MCGKDSVGELCNACIRTEEVKYSREWVAKEGVLVKKTEDYKVVLSSVGVSGRFAICDNLRWLNVRVDSATHYIKNIKGVEMGTYNKKEAPAICVENPTTGMKRYLFMPMFDGDKSELTKVIQSNQ